MTSYYRKHVCMSQKPQNIIDLYATFITIWIHSDYLNPLILSVYCHFRCNIHSMASSGDSEPPSNIPNPGVIPVGTLPRFVSPILAPAFVFSSAAVSAANSAIEVGLRYTIEKCRRKAWRRNAAQFLAVRRLLAICCFSSPWNIKQAASDPLSLNLSELMLILSCVYFLSCCLFI